MIECSFVQVQVPGRNRHPSTATLYPTFDMYLNLQSQENELEPSPLPYTITAAVVLFLFATMFLATQV